MASHDRLHDIDIVVKLDDKVIPMLLSAFPTPRYYLSESALREGRRANLLDTTTGDKADLFVLGTSPQGCLNSVAGSG